MFGSRPGRIRARISIDLPFPRNVEEMRYEPRFVELSHQLRDELRHANPISEED